MASNFTKWGDDYGQTAIRVRNGFIITGWEPTDWHDVSRVGIKVKANELDDLIAKLLNLRKRTERK